MQQYTKVGGAQFWEKLERELGRAVDPAHDIHTKRIENCCRRFTSSWSGGVRLWQIAPLFADF
jgi:hypothetical protein